MSKIARRARSKSAAPAGCSDRHATNRSGRITTAPSAPTPAVSVQPELALAFRPLFRSTQRVLADYRTAELELLVGFMRQLGEATEELIRSMRGQVAEYGGEE